MRLCFAVPDVVFREKTKAAALLRPPWQCVCVCKS